MKILYDCFSCSPYYGSDEGIGWMWPYLMRQYHDVWVLVRKDRKPDIEHYCTQHNIDNIHFVYCDIPDWMNFYYRRLAKNKNGVLDFLAYQYLWQFPAYMSAKRLHKKIQFDLVHHVCTNDFRILGFMYKLNIPYIIGPIGGAQETPDGLRYYVRNHQKSEKLRSLLNKLMICLPGYKKALNVADRVYFSNTETRDFLLPYIKNHNKCELLTEIGYHCSNLSQSSTTDKSDKKTVFMWAGRMEYRKGLELLVDVLKSLPLDKYWELILCGDGGEREYIQQICSQEPFADRVIFLGKLPYEKVQQIYQETNVFVFPSLRETTGTVIIEAMAQGIPVICLKQGGGALVVNEETGFLIPVDNKEKCIQCFRNAMLQCICNPSMVKQKGNKARERVFTHFSWSEKILNMEQSYKHLLEL